MAEDEANEAEDAEAEHVDPTIKASSATAADPAALPSRATAAPPLQANTTKGNVTNILESTPK